jgi:hypothetical protein
MCAILTAFLTLPLTSYIATEESANKVMNLLRADVTGRGVTEESLQIPLPLLDGGGIKSTHLVSSLPRDFPLFSDTDSVLGSLTKPMTS